MLIYNTRIIHRVHGTINLNTTVIRVDACEMILSMRIVLAAHLKQVQISSNSMITGLVFKTSGKSGYLSILIPLFVFRRPRRAVTAVKCSRRCRARPPSFPSKLLLPNLQRAQISYLRVFGRCREELSAKDRCPAASVRVL